MGIRERFATWMFRGLKPPFPWVPRWQAGRPAWTDWSVEKATKEGYRAHPTVHLCIRRLADATASVPWVAKHRGAKGDEVLEDHPAAALLRAPNPRASWDDIIDMLTLDLNLGGNGYWLFLRQGTAQELWRLRPDRTKVIPGTETLISGYEYTVGAEKRILPVRDDAKGIAVVHFRFIDPGNDYYGLSPLRAGARIVDTDNAAIAWNKLSLDNQARPSGALSTGKLLPREEYDRLRKELDEEISGAANARRPLLLEGGLQWQQHGMTPAEMDFLKGREWNAIEICNLFGVRPEWLGIIQAKFENARQGRRMTWEDTIIPSLVNCRGTMNLDLAPMFGDDIFFDFDVSQTPAVLEARKELVDQAKTVWGMGVPFDVVNDQLGLGFDPVPGGDVGYLPVTVLPVGGGTQAGGGRATGAETRVVNLATEDQRAAYWRAFDRRRQGWERGLAARVRGRFEEEMQAVLQGVEAGQWELNPVITAQEEDWNLLLLVTWQAVFEDFGEQAAEALGMEIPGRGVGPEDNRDVWDPWPVEAKTFVARTLAEHVVEISEATKLAVRKEIQAALDAAEGTPQIAKRIRALYSGFGRHRSFVIARTEVGGAANYGTHNAASQSGVVEKHTWVSSRDDRVRDSHTAIDGQSQPLRTAYSNGCMFPCDPAGPAAEVIQCRCVESFGTGK